MIVYIQNYTTGRAVGQNGRLLVRLQPSEAQVKVTLQLTASQPVCLGIKPLHRAHDQILPTISNHS
jgi:hypothetical protein